MSSREPLDCSVDPVPPSERTNLGGIRLQLRERRLNRGDLVGQRRIYLPFDRPPELLQDALGRVQLRTVRRQPNQRQTQRPYVRITVARRPIPDQSLHLGRLLQPPA